MLLADATGEMLEAGVDRHARARSRRGLPGRISHTPGSRLPPEKSRDNLSRVKSGEIDERMGGLGGGRPWGGPARVLW